VFYLFTTANGNYFAAAAKLEERMKLYLVILIAVAAITGCTTATDPAYDKTGADKKTAESPAGETKENFGETNATPKDAILAFVKALESKDEAAVKASLSEKTNKMLALQTKMTGRSVVDIFNSKEFEDISKVPDMRNEKIEGDKATLEVKDPKDEKWDEMPLVKENGSWKLAFADADYDKDYENMVKQVEKAGKAMDDGKKTESEADSGKETTEKKPAS